MAETDRAFLERKRKQLKASAAFGWVFLVIPLVFGVVVAGQSGQIVDWIGRFHGPMAQQLSSESQELQSLVTATELERILVGLVLRKNELIDRLFSSLFLAGLAVFGFAIVQICVLGGAMLLSVRRDYRRFLTVIDDLEQQCRSGVMKSS
jgi:ABC-type Fe3+ transport system permease subunit